jgi:hypothetical protein
MIISLLSEFKFNWNCHVWDVPLSNIILCSKIIISTQILFTAGSTLTKCSMLALVYRMVSKTSGIFPRIVIGTSVLVAVQGSLFCFMVISQCRFVSPSHSTTSQRNILIKEGAKTNINLLDPLLHPPTLHKPNPPPPHRRPNKHPHRPPHNHPPPPHSLEPQTSPPPNAYHRPALHRQVACNCCWGSEDVLYVSSDEQLRCYLEYVCGLVE